MLNGGENMEEHKCKPRLWDFLWASPLENLTCKTCGAEIEPKYWWIFLVRIPVFFLMYCSLATDLKHLFQPLSGTLGFIVKILLLIISFAPIFLLSHAA